MKKKQLSVMIVALCAFTGVAVGGAASMPVSATDTPAAATSDSAAENGSAGPVSDCDLLDIDGNNNTVSTNITDNTTVGDGGVTVQYHCGNNASTLDHDLIDVDGNNNSVTVFIRAENATIDFGAPGSAANSNGLHVGLNCGIGTADDCDGVDIDGYNNSVTLIVTNNTERTVHEFGANSDNVSWTGSEQNTGTGVNNSTNGSDRITDERDNRNDGENGTTDEHHETNSGNDTVTETNRSNDVLDMVVDGIPLIGTATLLVLGSALVVKRNNN